MLFTNSSSINLLDDIEMKMLYFVILYATLLWMSLHYNTKYEPQHEISNNVVCATSKASVQPAHMHSLISAFAGRLNILWV